MTQSAAAELQELPPRVSRQGLWWLGSLLLVVLLAAVSSLGALARVDQQRAGIEQFLRDRTGLDVRFARLRIQLGFYGPEAVFSEVDFRQPGVTATLLHAQSVTARFEYFRVLRSGELQPGLVTVHDADLYLDTLGDGPAATSSQLAAARGSPQAQHLLAEFERSSFAHAALFAAAAPQARLRFEALALHLRRGPQSADTWVLQSPMIALEKSSQGLHAHGTVKLPERLGQSVWFRLDSPAPLTTSGTLQLRTRGLNLTPWRELAGISAEVGGALDLQIDARWSQARWQEARSTLRWRVEDEEMTAALQFDRGDAALRVDAAQVPLAAMQQLWRAFDPSARVLTAMSDIEPRGTVSDLHLRWTPGAPIGERTHVSAQVHGLQLRSKLQRLQLAPLEAQITANERALAISIVATDAELRDADAAEGSGRPVKFHAALTSQGGSAWHLELNDASLGPLRDGQMPASDGPVPPIERMRGALRWDMRGAWHGELAGRAAEQDFAMHWQGDAVQAVLDAQSPANWRARLRLQPGPSGQWRAVAGRIVLGPSKQPITLPRKQEIRIAGRLVSADLLTLQPLFTRWPHGAWMAPWQGQIQVSRLNLGGQPLGAARIAVQRRGARTRLTVNSAALAGELQLSPEGEWSADFRRAHFSSASSSDLLATVLGQRLRANVNIADLRMGDRRLGRLSMQIESGEDELRLQRIALLGPAALRGSGRCRLDSGDCALRLALRGDDLGAWLQHLEQSGAASVSSSGVGGQSFRGTLRGTDLRGEVRLIWPLRDSRAWLDSLSADATVNANNVALDDQESMRSSPWLVALQDVPASRFDRLAARVRWQDRRLQLDSVRLIQAGGELSLAGLLDYGARQIDEQVTWQPLPTQGALPTLPGALAALESVARDQVPALAGAVGGVGRWVSGSPAPLRWQVSGSMDAPLVQPVVAE